MEAKYSLADLTARLERFRDERDWAQFHSLKDLSAGISIEAAELQEIFLWSRDEEDTLSARRSDVEDELSDVLIQCLNFASIASIDVSKAVDAKIEQNERKYPVDQARGTARKYTDL